MAAEVLLSAELGYMSEEEAKRVTALYARAGLPTKIPDYIDREELVKKLYTDKQVRDGKLRFVLQKGIGSMVEFSQGVYSKPIEESLAREIIMEL
jgi:3-dehydroquinate synthase